MFLTPFVISAQNEPPNVIVIISDDMNDSVEGMGGHSQALTPNINRLMDMGSSIYQRPCQCANCSPSRAVVIGLYPKTTDTFMVIINNKIVGVIFQFLSDAVTVMEHFRDHGYKVYGSGKIFFTTDMMIILFLTAFRWRGIKFWSLSLGWGFYSFME